VSLFFGQILSASLAARFTGDFTWPDSWLIGFGMLGRAELAFVVMEIAYVQTQVMSDSAFYTLMITCFLLNISVPLSIRWWKRYMAPTTST
jgi:Kef-type K+ transport system membrane component KefB